MRIDAHQHYWKVDRGDYGWITPGIPSMYRDFLPVDLVPHLRSSGLGKTIVVQAAPTIEETLYLLELSVSNESIAGVVGWLDLSVEGHEEHFEYFCRYPKFVGFRLMLQGMPDARAILEPPVIQALQYYADRDVPIDLLASSSQLDVIIELLHQVPGMRGVVNHIGKPGIKEGIFEPWASQMSAIARHPGIYCKLSGMANEANRQAWKYEDFTAYVRHILILFGYERVMFGSDWPVCLLAASYEEVVEIVLRALPENVAEEQLERLFGGNATVFYKLATC